MVMIIQPSSPTYERVIIHLNVWPRVAALAMPGSYDIDGNRVFVSSRTAHGEYLIVSLLAELFELTTGILNQIRAVQPPYSRSLGELVTVVGGATWCPRHLPMVIISEMLCIINCMYSCQLALVCISWRLQPPPIIAAQLFNMVASPNWAYEDIWMQCEARLAYAYLVLRQQNGGEEAARRLWGIDARGESVSRFWGGTFDRQFGCAVIRCAARLHDPPLDV